MFAADGSAQSKDFFVEAFGESFEPGAVIERWRREEWSQVQLSGGGVSVQRSGDFVLLKHSLCRCQEFV